MGWRRARFLRNAITATGTVTATFGEARKASEELDIAHPRTTVACLSVIAAGYEHCAAFLHWGFYGIFAFFLRHFCQGS